MPELKRIAVALERLNKNIERLIMRTEDDGERCPDCGSENVEDISTMGNPKMICLACNRSWVPELLEVS